MPGYIGLGYAWLGFSLSHRERKLALATSPTTPRLTLVCAHNFSVRLVCLYKMQATLHERNILRLTAVSGKGILSNY